MGPFKLNELRLGSKKDKIAAFEFIMTGTISLPRVKKSLTRVLLKTGHHKPCKWRTEARSILKYLPYA